jgi:hypothetical protein
VNGGLNFFYGWRSNDYGEYLPTVPAAEAYSMTGGHYGIRASVGALIKGAGASFEPYVAGGFERYDLSGSGYYSAISIPTASLKNDIWSIGAGMSVRF